MPFLMEAQHMVVNQSDMKNNSKHSRSFILQEYIFWDEQTK